MIQSAKIIPVILAGGQGIRLWPTSTPDLPKQFIPLKVGGTTFENAIKRIHNQDVFETPVIICARQNIGIVELLTHGMNARIICEPLGRNTAPACCIGSLAAQESGGESAVMLIMPADHYISDIALFEDTVRTATAAAQSRKIVTFGIRPEFGCTEYGYIERGENIGNGVYQVRSFTEKPRVKAAQSYFKNGNYYWNSGIFLVRADRVLEEMKTYQSDILLYAREAWKNMQIMDGHRLLPLGIFEKLPKISFDYAIMENTSAACVAEASFKWQDLGGWAALMEFLPPEPLAS